MSGSRPKKTSTKQTLNLHHKACPIAVPTLSWLCVTKVTQRDPNIIWICKPFYYARLPKFRTFNPQPKTLAAQSYNLTIRTKPYTRPRHARSRPEGTWLMCAPGQFTPCSRTSKCTSLTVSNQRFKVLVAFLRFKVQGCRVSSLGQMALNLGFSGSVSCRGLRWRGF